MKKVGLILIGILVICGVVAFGIYQNGMSRVSDDTTVVVFMIEPGTSKKEVARNLEKDGLIKNSLVLEAYLILHKDMNIQAGEYELTKSMTPEEMLRKFENGDVKIHTKTVTLVEGKRLEDYATTLSQTFDFTKKDFMDVVDDPEYINELIDQYWFLTDDVLQEGIYHPLEGYLYPDTYEFLETSNEKDIIERLLSHMGEKLSTYQSEIEQSSYSVHELLTLASIVEKETTREEDRAQAAQVFYSRLQDYWSLGSDVTTYYGVNKDMGDTLTIYDILDSNPYNTRLTDGSMNGKLPIGPICNIHITSLDATLHPSDTNYYYFVANVCTGEVFFQESNNEFLAKVKELQLACASN